MYSSSRYQPTLFDPKPAVILEIRLATEKKEQGINRAEGRANRKVKDWSRRAYEIILEYINSVPGEFMAEDIRAYAACKDDFELPDNSRAWGGPISRAARDGHIRFVRNDKTKNVKAHRTPAAVWIKN